MDFVDNATAQRTKLMASTPVIKLCIGASLHSGHGAENCYQHLSTMSSSISEANHVVSDHTPDKHLLITLIIRTRKELLILKSKSLRK